MYNIKHGYGDSRDVVIAQTTYEATLLMIILTKLDSKQKESIAPRHYEVHKKNKIKRILSTDATIWDLREHNKRPAGTRQERLRPDRSDRGG